MSDELVGDRKFVLDDASLADVETRIIEQVVSHMRANLKGDFSAHPIEFDDGSCAILFAFRDSGEIIGAIGYRDEDHADEATRSILAAVRNAIESDDDLEGTVEVTSVSNYNDDD